MRAAKSGTRIELWTGRADRASAVAAVSPGEEIDSATGTLGDGGGLEQSGDVHQAVARSIRACRLERHQPARFDLVAEGRGGAVCREPSQPRGGGAGVTAAEGERRRLDLGC